MNLKELADTIAADVAQIYAIPAAHYILHCDMKFLGRRLQVEESIQRAIKQSVIEAIYRYESAQTRDIAME
jgi:hypothetical protein